jgi:hypothetical protein|tara:strand:- start:376 stop:702 length:327 start_codon:yes stop_codon:yes gene_type:complete
MIFNWKKYPKQEKLSSRDTIIISKPDGSTKNLTVNALKGAPNYTHTQSAASATWTITHNLNKFPAITVVDSGGSVVKGEILYNSANQLTLTFYAGGSTSAFSGKAYLN